MNKKKAAKKLLKFFLVGCVNTLSDFILYNLFLKLVFGGNNDLSWLAILCAGAISIFITYFLHKNITWKERNPGKFGIVKFFIWGEFSALALKPFFSFIYTPLTGLYQFAFGICQWLHLPFDYSFVESTGIYVLAVVSNAVLNFFFYEKIVFGKKKDTKEGQKQVDVESVRESGEKE